VQWPETVVVETTITDIGRSSASLFQEMRSAADASVRYADSDCRIVWANLIEGRSRPWPEALRAKFLEHADGGTTV